MVDLIMIKPFKVGLKLNTPILRREKTTTEVTFSLFLLFMH